MSAPKTVLFVCIHNSARSQMAEAFVNARHGKHVRAYSAGLEAGSLNPVVVTAMAELGIDLGANRSKSVNDPDIRSRDYDYVVTVCDEASAEACPIYPTNGERLHWSFADPSAFTGTPDERLARTREVRDAIASRLEAWRASLPAL
ncbi:MAG: low molecular weight phosphotyrosine protein phosphatase [Candidatus Eremiobacteraeota bacterium]|nr:low molecular weight phosphotyrosine protein phosphatase [Candidatus Eremiobacteraeota bacterium]